MTSKRTRTHWMRRFDCRTRSKATRYECFFLFLFCSCHGMSMFYFSLDSCSFLVDACVRACMRVKTYARLATIRQSASRQSWLTTRIGRVRSSTCLPTSSGCSCSRPSGLCRKIDSQHNECSYSLCEFLLSVCVQSWCVVFG